jgi:tetratricopeptide (TPR) repeat protein
LAKKGETSSAIAHFSRVIELNPRYITAYVNLAIIQYHQGRVSEAEKILLKALEIDRDYSYAHNNLGIIRANKGDIEDAIHHYLVAVRNNPTFLQARVNLSEAYEKAGFYHRAIAEYDVLVKMMPDNKAPIYYRMAGLYALLSNFDESEKYLELALTNGLDVFKSIESDARFKDFKKGSNYNNLASAFRH